MANPTTVTINCETGEAIEREMTADELANYNALKASVDADIAAPQQLAQDKMIQDKQAAQAKLAALGLTPDDLKALGL
jgi:hypothetical protein